MTACFTVAGTIFAAYNWLLSGRAENAPIVRQLVLKDEVQDKRLDRTDEDRAITKELTQKTGELKEAVVKLTTVLENTPTRKAEYYFENILRGRACPRWRCGVDSSRLEEDLGHSYVAWCGYALFFLNALDASYWFFLGYAPIAPWAMGPRLCADRPRDPLPARQASEEHFRRHPCR
ncbi:hypothetical protein U8P73_36665 (plasmid) [Rhizobium beringeri]|uniref:hypothetical protein n=1 Tax=Rhizobium beringeri TaxID=3019934 RepID=UPI002DDD8870|nr:hypothetical protein [Rhizobium beringeri]WSG93506.1 hypothetical protein U8P73_36665 [Rhizobium beringeri]